METAMVADYHNWKKNQSIKQKILIKIFHLFGIYFSGYNDGWKSAMELVENHKNFEQECHKTSSRSDKILESSDKSIFNTKSPKCAYYSPGTKCVFDATKECDYCVCYLHGRNF